MKKKLFKKVLSLLVCMAMILSYIPSLGVYAKAAVNVVDGSKKADPATLNGWEAYFGENKLDTEFAGAVWTDKSVFAAANNALPGVALTDNGNFLVALSAIASNVAITGHTSAPTDTMLVLDMSGSMVDDTYEVGTIRQNSYSYQAATAIDMSLIDAMIDATNDTIDKLMKQNTNNRVGVVLYSGNAEASQAATPGTATVVLPLGRYAGVNGAYLSVDATTQTEELYRRVTSWFGSSWEATGETVTYVPSGTNVNVSVADGLKTEAGANVTDTSKRANGGTYIQNGLYQAMGQFLKVTDTTVPDGRPQAGAERLPVIVLMSDGAPTIATTSYTNIGNSNTGDGTTTDDRITFLTQLTAAYVRGRVASHYQESNADEKDILFLTLGLGTENSSAATNTLYPAGSNSDLVTYWDRYLRANPNQNVTAITGNNSLTVRREADVEAMNYVDTYYYASNAQDLIDSFQEIVSEISLKAESYATLVEGSGADFSGYVTFEDELGELMQVYNVAGILLGNTLFTGRELAKGMNNDNLGPVDNPNARGDELVRTVKERIPGTTTTQAQQLINNAYLDQQLYYANDNSWSNYIGWYADENGNYVGFWDKDSGYENAPEGAVYANKSYGYLGVNGDSDMMHTVVMVRTELATLHQSVIFKVPAALLPMVQYSVTLDEDDPSKVQEFVREGAEPIRLVVEVGVREDLNAVNMNDKIAAHIAKGGHVHRNDDGTVTFYTNQWAIGNDQNGNGIPDPEEVDSAVVAQSHFHPALDNSRFYYTEDTPILTGNDAVVTGSTRPSGTGYYYNRYIYSASGRTAVKTPIAATTLANDAQYDSENGRWYVPSGTMYHDLARFQTPKAANNTNTLAYSFFPAVFDGVGKQDVYTFLGNNGSVTVAPAQGIALTKTIDELSEDAGAPTEFTFTVTLSQAVASPVITDTDGNPITGIASVSGNVITVKLTAGQTVLITGIPTGTTYTVEEVQSDYYKASSANASGTVAAYTVHAVDFVNTAKHYGALVVGKAVNYPQGFVPGTAHGAKEFTVHVEFTGDVSGMVAPTGAVQNGNIFTLTLKDGQSATFANIPEGVTYTVTESGLPAGYALQEIRYSDEDKDIDGKDLDQVHVVNRYTLEPVSPKVKIWGEKNLVANESGWENEEFTVELLQLENFADETPESTGLKATMTAEVPYEIDLSPLPFTHAGTYYFRAVEVIPTPRNEDIAYDRTFGLFSITVGDAYADGKLEIQAVDAYQSTTVSGDAENGWVLRKDFTNVVNTDRIYLDIQKYVVDADTGAAVNAHRGDITFGLFSAMTDTTPDYYALTSTQGEATLMIPVTKGDITDAGGTIRYYLREIAPAVENRVVGMHYDESWIYVVDITWDDEKAVVQYAPIENDVVGEYVPYADGFVFEHTNTYEDDVKVTVDLTGKKTLNGGNALGDREFSFSLHEATAAFVKGDKIKTVTNSGNNISFNNITFTAPGVYYMVAAEEPSELGGITIDATEYHITVAVEKYVGSDGTTRLRVVDGYPVVIPFGTADNVGVDKLDFNNRYTVTGEGSVTIGGKKELSGRALAADEFTIGLYRDEACTDLIESVANKADGTFAFTTISYTVEHLENLEEKTYFYYVKEIPGDKGGVTYDKDTYTVTVKVSHKEGELVVTPSNNATTLKISNTYEADPVSVTINGSKALSGNWNAVDRENKKFTFQLFQANSNFVITDTVPFKTASVIGKDNFSMTLEYSDGNEGFYYYVLKEDTSAQASGVGYDAGEYHITVNVSDPGNGKLVATTTIYRPGSGNSSTAVFTNTYTVEPTEITLEGTKAYKHSLTDQDLPMEDEQFAFLVLEGENLAATGYNKADGTIVFTPIRYTAAGVHTYSVVEVPGDAGGVEYDSTVFTVTVTVTDNGDGTLTAEADYDGEPVAFVNRYSHAAAQVTFNGEKLLNGDWSNVPDANKIFTFEMYETDETFTVTGALVDSYTGEAGAYTFGAQNYTAEGIHHYVILEAAGAADKGITYDQNRYHITVEVVDDGVGKLIPTVTVVEGAATVTADATNQGVVTLNGLNFTNGYEAAPAQYTPEAQKIYARDEQVQMEAFDFVLTVDGNPKQTKQNDAEGKVLFDQLTFEAPGAYTLTIREQESALFGLIRWDRNVYTITLHVEDNGRGQLMVNDTKTTITSDKGDIDLIFRNAHHDVITEKDVFSPAAPTVSIDGKTVELNDILLYKISYTNYDSVPVNIKITDVIPLYTTYVDGSADFGGTLVGDTLEWTITDVNPAEVVTVSFQVKVMQTNVTVVNGATVLEGNNEYLTNEVTNPVKDDIIKKDVFRPEAPTVSIDSKTVELNDILLYKVTYTNSDDFDAKVTITDKIPQYTTYVEGSADFGGTYDGETLTWELPFAAGETKTVSFQVKVAATSITVVNQASALEGTNRLDSNIVRNPVGEDLIVKDVFTVTEPTVSIDGKAVEKGDILLYKVTYTNSDGADAQVTVTDKIPQHTAYVEGSADFGGTYDGETLTWELQLAAGESKTVSFQVKVTGQEGDTVINSASSVEGDNQVESNQVTNPVKEDVILKDVFTVTEPTVSIDGKAVEKGDILLYKVTYTNSDDFAAQVTVTDTIPQYTAYVEGSADFGGTYDGETLTWELPFAAGETKTVSFQVKVTGANGDTVINGASGVDGENRIDSNKVTNPIKEDTIEKDVFTVTEPTVSIDGKAVEKGDVLLYKVTYTNSDDFDAKVTVTDTIPQYTAYVENSADNGGVYEDGKLTWTLELAAGESKTVSFQVKVTGANGDTVINGASGVEGENRIDSNKVTNPIKEDTIEKDVFAVAKPTVSIDGKMVELNDTLLYKVTYTNSDDFAARVTVTDQIPEHTQYVKGSADNGGVYADGKLTWTLDLAAGESKTVSFRVKVVATKITVVNQASALEGTNRLDSNIVRNPVEEDLLVKDVFTAYDPTVSIDGKAVEKGDTLLYKVTYTNSDGADAQITVTDTIPQYTAYVENSADNGGVYADGKLTWTLDLAAGESKTVSFQVKVIETNITVVNQATALEGDNRIESNKVTNPVVEDLVSKDVFLPEAPTVSIDGETVNPGQLLLYKVTYTNSDDFDATVTITDAIPKYTTYVENSADNGGVYADGKLTWKLQLAAGESKTVSFQVKVIETNITVENQATALEGENQLQTNVVTNPVEDDLLVKDVFAPKTSTVISIDGKTVNKGDLLLYTITYTNTDIGAATVTITDAIPEHTQYVKGSADNGGLYENGKITWMLELAAGETKTVSFGVKVDDYGITVVNQATALAGENSVDSNAVTNPVMDPPESPQTGDSTNLGLLIGVTLSSLACLVVLIIAKKRIVTKEEN